MSEKTFNSIKQIIEQFNESIKQQLPLLESEVNRLIVSKTKDGNVIEHHLDTLVSPSLHGTGTDLFRGEAAHTGGYYLTKKMKSKLK